MKKLLSRFKQSLSSRQLKWILNCWPPLWFTGIRIESISNDFKYARVIMRLRWYNKNYVGVHFGGSLYSMTDPFYMLMLMKNLPANYIVWDYSADIKFIKPGRDTVVAEFVLDDKVINLIKDKTAQGNKYIAPFRVDIKNSQDELVCQVNKLVYIKLKQASIEA